MNKKTFGCLLLCASLACAQGPGAFVRPGGPGGGRGGPGGGFGGERIVAGAPYSAVEVQQFQDQLADGNTISRTHQTALYRDSQGRTRTEVVVTPPASTGKQPYTRITISDVVAGKRYELDSSTNTYTTSRIPTAAAIAARGVGRGGGQARQAAPPARAAVVAGTRTGRNGSTVNTEVLGTQLKNGALASGSRETEVIPSGKVGNSQPLTVVRETWYSTELKRNIQVKVTDPQRGNSSTELTNLVAGEPSAALFTLPAGYTEKAQARGRGPGGPGGPGGFGRRGGPPAGAGQ